MIILGASSVKMCTIAAQSVLFTALHTKGLLLFPQKEIKKVPQIFSPVFFFREREKLKFRRHSSLGFSNNNLGVTPKTATMTINFRAVFCQYVVVWRGYHYTTMAASRPISCVWVIIIVKWRWWAISNLFLTLISINESRDGHCTQTSFNIPEIWRNKKLWLKCIFKW